MELSDWLPILTHPEVGERICEKAGLVLDVAAGICHFKSLDWMQHNNIIPINREIPEWALAALAFGGLAVLDDDGYELHAFVASISNPHAVLAALQRVYITSSGD